MKQLEVMNLATLTEKSSKIQHKAVSQNQRKYMAEKHVKPLWKPLRITRKLFKTSKHHEKMSTFLRRNTNFEISSFRAIYFSDCVFNLTMPK